MAPSKSPKYPQTRELIRVANKVYSQQELARRCRTQQSTISRWANGDALAREAQVAGLAEEFAHKLERAKSRIYYVEEMNPVPFEERKEGKAWVEFEAACEALKAEFTEAYEAQTQERQAEAAREAEAAAKEAAAKEAKVTEAKVTEAEPQRQRRKTRSTNAAVKADSIKVQEIRDRQQELHSTFMGTWDLKGAFDVEQTLRTPNDKLYSIQRVTGRILWRHELRKELFIDRYRNNNAWKELNWRTTQRWLVHQLPVGGNFVLAVQDRRRFQQQNAIRWHNESGLRHHSALLRDGSEVDRASVHCPVDEGLWTTTLEGPFSIEELLHRVDALAALAGPNDTETIPFLIRKALAEHGHELEDIRAFP